MAARAMRFKDVCAFHGRWTRSANWELWALTEACRAMRTPHVFLREPVRKRCDSVCSPRTSALRRGRFLLQDASRPRTFYWSILGRCRAAQTGIQRDRGPRGRGANQLTRYLKCAVGPRLITRDVPVTERAPEKEQRGLYQSTMPSCALWFGCVVSFESLLEFGRSNRSKPLCRNDWLVSRVASSGPVATRRTSSSLAA